jgi:hypothetical protein
MRGVETGSDDGVGTSPVKEFWRRECVHAIAEFLHVRAAFAFQRRCTAAGSGDHCGCIMMAPVTRKFLIDTMINAR